MRNLRNILWNSLLTSVVALPMLACDAVDGPVVGLPPQQQDLPDAAPRLLSGSAVHFDLETGAETFLAPPRPGAQAPMALASGTGYTEERSESEVDLDFEPLGPDFAPPPAIIGSDGRVKVTDTTTSPYNRVVKLYMTFSNGDTYPCSGSMVGPRTALTAGHCLFDHWNGLGWATSVEVVPAKNDGSEPYGSTFSTSLSVSGEWQEDMDYDHDWGLVNTTNHLGEITGWFGTAWLTDDSLEDLDIQMVGYPDDQDGGRCMYRSHDRVMNTSAHQLAYENDSYYGMSGGPVLPEEGAWTHYVVAVHSGSGGVYNRGTRITSALFHHIRDHVSDAGEMPETARWSMTNEYQSQLATWAAKDGVQVIPGRFNHDDYTDFVLTGRFGWSTVPVAFGDGDGGFSYTNEYVPWVPGWTDDPSVTVHAADFDGDGLTDLALTNSSDWNSVPLAFSNGDGTFTVVNSYQPEAAIWARTWGVDVVAGRFDDDECADLAYTGSGIWGEIRLALSDCNGGFTTATHDVEYVDTWASMLDVQLRVGNFDGDDHDDILITGGDGWNSMPVAFSNGDGTFTVTNRGVAHAPQWATEDDVQILVGNFDGAGGDDVAFTGVRNWNSIPIAISNGDGTFTIDNPDASLFAMLAQMEGVTAVAGTFDAGSTADVAFVGSELWNSIPIAMGH